MTDTHTQQAIGIAEEAYAVSIARHLFNLCDFQEEALFPTDYFLFDGYVARHEIEADIVPSSNNTTFYLSGNNTTLAVYKEELEAYFLAEDNVLFAHLCTNQPSGESVFFVTLKKGMEQAAGEEFLLNGFGYVAFCVEEQQEIITDLSF